MLYEYRCQNKDCTELTEAYRSVENRNDAPECSHCGAWTRKIISVNYRVHADFEEYYDDNLETGIKSKQHREQVMKEKGVTEAYGKGWT